jgi:hypothetical protein
MCVCVRAFIHVILCPTSSTPPLPHTLPDISGDYLRLSISMSASVPLVVHRPDYASSKSTANATFRPSGCQRITEWESSRSSASASPKYVVMCGTLLVLQSLSSSFLRTVSCSRTADRPRRYHHRCVQIKASEGGVRSILRLPLHTPSLRDLPRIPSSILLPTNSRYSLLDRVFQLPEPYATIAITFSYKYKFLSMFLQF